MKRFEIGEKVTLRVAAVQADTVFLDLNAKSEGVLDASEMLDANGKCTLKAGESIAVYYIGNVNGEEKFTTRIASSGGGRGGDGEDGLAILERAFEKGIPALGKVDKEIKGGYEVLLGNRRAFCPYSQSGKEAHGASDGYIGRTLAFRITEMKDSGRRVVLSRRAIEEEERESASNELSLKVHIGDTMEARVTQIRDFGAFVDIGGFEALLPISEIAREKVTDAANYLSVGQKINVKVIGADWQRGRVSVSLKALLRDPWENADVKYSKGTKHEGVVTRTAPFGVFVELESGLEGLMHISTIEGLERNTNISKVFIKGQKISVKVLGIDTIDRRVSLAPTTSEEQDKETQHYMAGQTEKDDTYNPFAALLKH